MRSRTLVAGQIAVAWGILFAVGGIALGIPAVQRNGILSGQALFHLGLAVLAAGECYAGVALTAGKRRATASSTMAGVTAIGLAAVVPAPLLLIGAAVNVVILALLIAGRAQSSTSART